VHIVSPCLGLSFFAFFSPMLEGFTDIVMHILWEPPGKRHRYVFALPYSSISFLASFVPVLEGLSNLIQQSLDRLLGKEVYFNTLFCLNLALLLSLHFCLY
jgi:hypothetical protein